MLDALTSLPDHFRRIEVIEPGTVQALNMGLEHVTGDIMAITDDDAAPHAEWLERIERHFASRSDLGGVGGRDYLHVNSILQVGSAATVGRIRGVFPHVGNHHLGAGSPREVEILKGVNGSYRVEALRPVKFDTRLRGTGAQVHWEISLGLQLKANGWKLLYDPAVAVDHFLAPRFDEDQRDAFNALALRNLAYNEAMIRLEHLNPLGRFAFLLWSVLIGSRITPGFVQMLRFLPASGSLSWRRFITTVVGRNDAWKEVMNRSAKLNGP